MQEGRGHTSYYKVGVGFQKGGGLGVPPPARSAELLMISKYYEINTHITVAYMPFALPNDIHALSPVGKFAHGQRRIQDFWKGGSNNYIHKRGWVLEGACPSRNS